MNRLDAVYSVNNDKGRREWSSKKKLQAIEFHFDFFNRLD